MGAAFASIPLQTDYAPPIAAARSGHGGGGGGGSGGSLPLSALPLATAAASLKPVQQLQKVRARPMSMVL